jgi:hypothetical protein
MTKDKSNVSDASKTNENAETWRWKDKIKKIINIDDAVSFFKVASAKYYVNHKVIQPVKSAVKKTLDYMETDDPETKEEEVAFDNLARQFMAGSVTLCKAKEQRINRRHLAESYLYKNDKGSRLSAKEIALQQQAMQDVVKREDNSDVKKSPSI